MTGENTGAQPPASGLESMLAETRKIAAQGQNQGVESVVPQPGQQQSQPGQMDQPGQAGQDKPWRQGTPKWVQERLDDMTKEKHEYRRLYEQEKLEKAQMNNQLQALMSDVKQLKEGTGPKDEWASLSETQLKNLHLEAIGGGDGKEANPALAQRALEEMINRQINAAKGEVTRQTQQAQQIAERKKRIEMEILQSLPEPYRVQLMDRNSEFSRMANIFYEQSKQELGASFVDQHPEYERDAINRAYIEMLKRNQGQFLTEEQRREMKQGATLPTGGDSFVEGAETPQQLFQKKVREGEPDQGLQELPGIQSMFKEVESIIKTGS